MYRLVIAEDEEEFRESIVTCLKGDAEGEYRVVGEASNGLEALERIEECSPDILITDICMPKLNGLEMIRRVLEIKPDIETIIISGYDDFHYVKEAMGMGVRDYLLKPFLPDELFQVLGKISNELQRKEALVRNMKYMHQKIEESKAYSQERFLRCLLENKEEMGEEDARELGFDTEANWYTCCVIRFFGNEVQGEPADFMEMMKIYLQIVEDNYFPPEIQCYNLNFEYNQVILIVSCREKYQITAIQDIRAGIERIGKSMEGYYHIRMRCTMGSLVQDYGALSDVYREALKTWKGVWDQKEVLVLYDAGRGQSHAPGIEDETELEYAVEAARNRLLMSIQMARKEAACASLNEILQQYSRLSADKFQYISVSLVELVLAISSLTAKAIGEQKAREDEAVIDFLEKYMRYGSLLEAKQVLEKYIEKSCEEFQNVNESQGDKIVNTAIDFIEANLSNEELSIELVADALHFSSNYIRKLFRSSLGESFSDFLFRKRMEKAAQLLQNPSYKIQDIAEQTGYSNQRYFARCFKKYYDCTPTDYRNVQK